MMRGLRYMFVELNSDSISNKIFFIKTPLQILGTVHLSIYMFALLIIQNTTLLSTQVHVD